MLNLFAYRKFNEENRLSCLLRVMVTTVAVLIMAYICGTLNSVGIQIKKGKSFQFLSFLQAKVIN